MAHKIITIGREFGSGGHEIGVQTAALLGIRLYEKDIVHIACRYGDVAVKTLKSADEKAVNPYLFQTVHEGNYHVIRGLPTSEVLFSLQSHEIRRIAQEEDCIFVGRCADHVLKDSEASLLRVFVHAPLEYRIQRKMRQEGLSYSKAARLVQKMDRQRRRYYRSYTGQEWGSPQRYDLYIDASGTTPAQAAEWIAARYHTLEPSAPRD